MRSAIILHSQQTSQQARASLVYMFSLNRLIKYTDHVSFLTQDTNPNTRTLAQIQQGRQIMQYIRDHCLQHHLMGECGGVGIDGKTLVRRWAIRQRDGIWSADRQSAYDTELQTGRRWMDIIRQAGAGFLVLLQPRHSAR